MDIDFLIYRHLINFKVKLNKRKKKIKKNF